MLYTTVLFKFDAFISAFKAAPMLSDMYTCIRCKRWVRRLQNLSKRACNSPVRADTSCIKVFSRSRAASGIVGVITIQFVKIIWAISVRGSCPAIELSPNHDGWHALIGLPAMSRQKALNISMPFLDSLTDYRQIAQENVEKLRTYDNY